MRHSRLAMGLLAAGILTAGTAGAQVIVTTGVGYAHDCFALAKAGTDPFDGVEACNQAIQHEPLTTKDRAATYDNRGVMLDQLGKTDRAESDFNKASSLDASLGDPHINLGSMLIKQRHYDEALVEINKGIDLGVSYPYVGYYDRAVAYEMMGRYKESYFDYKKVLELEPHFTQAAERLKDFTVTTVPAKTPG
jgi:tetratricopeptide (TPR) repeat protein